MFPATTVEGAFAVLKIQFPHPECEHEERFGAGAVKVQYNSLPAISRITHS